MNQATAILNALPVTNYGNYDGVNWLQTQVADLDFDKYKALPHVVEYLGKNFRKMSFNTDNNTVSYKESNAFATWS
jgi:hypothetical protein